MIWETINAGGNRNLAYLIGDRVGGTGALVDPPPKPERYTELVEQHQLDIQFIILTHGHGDHTWGVAEAKRRFAARVVGHESMADAIDVTLSDGCAFYVGELELLTIHTPGHADDGVCLLANNAKLLTGDTLFVGKVGGTDLGEGARKQWDALHRLMKLPDDIEIFPGHDFGVTPTSTLGHEKATNPFLLQSTFADFVDLKMNWIDYKRRHGIK